MHRRQFLTLGALASAHFAALGCRRPSSDTTPEPAAPATKTPAPSEPFTFGPLIENDAAPIDLPEGFSVQVVQRVGEPMSDGWPTPPLPDGMTCSATADGRWALLRNHEVRDIVWHGKPKLPDTAFSQTSFGGVSRVVIDPTTLAVQSSNLVLVGTQNNCAGGPVPGGWVTCEESVDDGHGWAFFCGADDASLQAPRPLRSWGRFCREAIALHDTTGQVYMTEDRGDGLLYRHTPTDAAKYLGEGKLQALSIPDWPHTNSPEALAKLSDGQRFKVTWVDIADHTAATVSCRAQGASAGATTFHRAEGIVYDGKYIVFVATTAGPAKAGQIWRLDLSDDSLTLVVQVKDRSMLSMPDNLTVAPWGDLIASEDNYDSQKGGPVNHMRVVRPDGTAYDLARNRKTPAEFAGASFSPDGRILFVNQQYPQGQTLAIQGPWPT